MKRMKWWLIALLLAAMAFIGAYFHVEGSEIAGVKEIDENCEVTISRYQHMQYEDREEYVLDSNGISDLKRLLLDSDFLRSNARYVTYDGDDSFYDIRIIFLKGQDALLIKSIGNRAIYVTDQFNGQHLNIQNDAWQETLESIIAR